MNILVIHPNLPDLFVGLATAVSRRIPRTNAIELMFNDTTPLPIFKYRMRQMYQDVEAIVYTSATIGGREHDRLVAVAEFAQQQQITLFVITDQSLLDDTNAGKFYRAASTMISSYVSKSFFVGLARFAEAASLGAAIFRLTDSGMFGRMHVTGAGDQVELAAVTQSDVPTRY